ncbi:MAG: DUF3221 domain-containing protein [Tissierellales bacterium]|jgi:hypothetical protein|nr:DUF3221 domain-containing protein [Tissierellales bacterium]HCX02991.1 hypothetical protein [Clostridiales bacterium]
MKIKLIIVLLISLMLLTACFNIENESDEGQLPADSGSELVTYSVAGRVTNITNNESEDKITILVESESENNGAEYDKASVTVTDETIIYGIDGNETNNIELGQYVRVFFEGEVMESYPVQATAKQVNIVPDESLEFNDDPAE